MSFFNPDQERANQIREASRMGEPEGGERPTLHVSRPRPKMPTTVNPRNSDRRPLAPRAKHTPKGHDAKLKAWQAEGRVISVIPVFGLSEGVDSITGAVIESDRYTITIRNEQGEHLIYKHAIAVITPFADATVTQ